MVSTARKLAFAAALCTASLAATPAFATIEMVDASSIQGAVVLFNNGTQTGTTVTGHTQNGTLVNFNGSTTASNVISANGGQAQVEGDLNNLTNNPNDTFALRTLNFALASGTFTNLEFNLFGASNGALAFFSALDNEGQSFTFNSAGYALGNGSNMFGFRGIDGQSIASFSISIGSSNNTTGTINDVRQIRLDQVAAVGSVPEPATWAMMLFGFGAIGVGMRRRRRTGQALLQVA